MSQAKTAANESDTLVHFGDALKSLDDSGRVGGYLVRFGDSAHKDLDGEFFTSETYYGARGGDGADCMFHHGLPIKGIDPEFSDHLFSPIKTKRDEVGVFAETILNLSDEFEAQVKYLIDKERLSWSSGAPVHMVRKTSDGEIKRWPIAEGSFTHRPAEPSNRIVSLKTFQGLFAPPAPAIKGLFKDKLAEQTPSFWQVQNILSEIARDIANAARSAKAMNTAFDARTPIRESLVEFVDAAAPLLVSQVEEFAQSSEEYFYLKTEHSAPDALAFMDFALKAGRRNSASDQGIINSIFKLLKELGASESADEASASSNPNDTAVKTNFLSQARLDLAALELSALS